MKITYLAILLPILLVPPVHALEGEVINHTDIQNLAPEGIALDFRFNITNGDIADIVYTVKFEVLSYEKHLTDYEVDFNATIAVSGQFDELSILRINVFAILYNDVYVALFIESRPEGAIFSNLELFVWTGYYLLTENQVNPPTVDQINQVGLGYYFLLLGSMVLGATMYHFSRSSKCSECNNKI